MNLYGREVDRRRLAELTGDPASVGGVRAVVLGDGAERGIRVLEFRTGGGLRFEVLIDRAMDIGHAEFDGMAVSWASPTGFRGPWFYEHNDEGGLSWLRSMSGLLVTGGLDHTLFGGTVDASQYRYPPRPSVWHGLHGRVANIPARLVGYGERWHAEGCTLWAEGEVRQATVFGEHLRLYRRIEADLGGAELRLKDIVVNAGFEPTPHMFLYHVNVGWPLLDEGARFEADIEKTTWQSDSVKEQGASNLELRDPAPGFIEQVYEHVLRAKDGRQRASLSNPHTGRRFELDWDADSFPCFFQWLNLRSGSYAVGLEPSTHHVGGDEAARREGSMTWLQYGEERHYDTVMRFG